MKKIEEALRAMIGDADALRQALSAAAGAGVQGQIQPGD